jgi:hypothetical protein
MKSIIKFLLIICIFQLLACSSIERPPLLEKKGKKYGRLDGKFTATFDDHYKIGKDYAKGGFFEAAKNQFKIAKGKENFDKSKVQTEGMHYIEYFPHREIGIMSYYQGNTSEALKYLEQSIAFESSPRAIYYLNCVRRAISQKQAKDTRPPSIAVQFPDTILLGKQYFTQRYNQPVSGQISDNDYVQSIWLDHQKVPVEKFSPTVSVNELISLSAGENIIHLTAVDVSGNVSKFKQSIFLDIMGPVISISSQAEELQKSAILKGHIMDESGIQKLDITVNGIIYPYPVQQNVLQIELNYPLPQTSPIMSIQIDAQDWVGNQSSIVVLDKRKQARLSSIMLASNDMFFAKTPSQQKPVIDIKDFEQIKDLLTKELPVRIEINHREAIESVSVLLNDHEIIANSQYQYKSNTLCLEPRLRFQSGKNKLQIIVNSDSDNSIKQTFRFRVHEQIRSRWKMKVALFPHKESVIKKRVSKRLMDFLISRFRIDGNVLSKDNFNHQIKQGCTDGLIACNGKQATLWSVEWDFGEITETEKPVMLVKKDNLNTFDKVLKLLRINKNVDTDMVPLKTFTGYLYLNNHLGHNLVKVEHYLETTEENRDQVIKHMCKYLSTKLINEMPVTECFINKIYKEKQAFQPDINPKIHHVKEGMRMIVFKPTFTSGNEDRNGIAEAEVRWIYDNSEVEALLCNPDYSGRVNMDHRVILR